MKNVPRGTFPKVHNLKGKKGLKSKKLGSNIKN